jgi:predicted ribosome quality control (RQC) complex YloA/Tae2 family protein
VYKLRIVIDYEKSIEENASKYYDKSKKARNKIEGAETAIIKAKEKKKKRIVIEKIPIKREWYEKFRWFISSENILVIGGRDATSNEIVVKKHTEKNDIVLHTDMAGSPFVIIKTEGQKIKKTLQEAADFTASYSKAWSKGMIMLEVFYVNPDQVTKQANSGEYLSKGSFMVRGKTNYLQGNIGLSLGNYERKVMSGPETAIKKHCENYTNIIPGRDKTSDIAKKVKYKIKTDLDETIRAIPSGGSKIKRG